MSLLGQNDMFDEQKVYKSFKIVRNQIREYFPKEIVVACINRLNIKFDSNKKYIQEKRKFPFWILFLLIKWTILYGEYLSPDRKHLSDKKFNYLIKLMHDFLGVQKTSNNYDFNYLFIRAIVYQQFWLKSISEVNKFGRQQKLFANLPSNHYFEKLFQQETNISIENFIELAYSLNTRFIKKNESFVTEKWFSSLENSYPKGTIKFFLFTISKDLENVKCYLGDLPNTNKSNEFHEHTPLSRYPLLKIKDKYYCYSSDLICYNTQNIIYDILRNKNVSKFMDKFGPTFEKYIEYGLKKAKLNFVKEDELKTKFDATKKIIDFVVIEQNANIFIEAKGVEFNIIGMVSDSLNIITERSRNSTLKGIEQYYSTVNQCRLKSDFIDIKNKGNYLIIVTYKDLYLGNGKIFLKTIAKSEHKKILEKFPDCSFLKSENIYIISVEDYDLLMELIIAKSKTIKEILDYSIKADSSNDNIKFLFRQHLLKIDPNLKHVRYLNKYHNEIVDNCLKKIKK